MAPLSEATMKLNNDVTTGFRRRTGHENGTLNIDALFPREAPSAAEGLNPAEFRTESFKSDAIPNAILATMHRNWLRAEDSPQPEVLGFEEIARFQHTTHATAVLRVLIASPRYEVHAADWTQVWSQRIGHRWLAEHRRGGPSGEITDTLSVSSRGRSTRVARTTTLRNGVGLVIVQGIASPDEFAPLANEFASILASTRTLPVAKQKPFEEIQEHSLRRPCGTFACPASWNTTLQSCLHRPQGDGVLLTPTSPDMGPALMGIESAPASAECDAGTMLDNLQRGLYKKGLLFGDPRIRKGPESSSFSECVGFESSGMINSIAVKVTISLKVNSHGVVAIWCIAPSCDAFKAAHAMTRRAFEIVRDTLLLGTPQKVTKR